MRATAHIIEDLLARQLLGLASDIARQHHILIGDMLSSSRSVPAPMARAALWTELHYLGWSSVRIAQFFGCHHTTILSAVKEIVAKRLAVGHCGRCGGDRRRPGSDEPCPLCSGGGVRAAKVAS